MKCNNDEKPNWIEQLNKALKHERNVPVSSEFETTDGKKFVKKTFVEEQQDEEIKKIIEDARKKEERSNTTIKRKKIACKTKTDTEKEIYKKAMLQRKQDKYLIDKKTNLYYKASLQVTNNDYEQAKQILALKKINLMDIGTDFTIDISAINIAIDKLDEMILNQHSEISFNGLTKIK